MPKKSSQTSKNLGRSVRARRIVTYLKKAYPEPKSELHYTTPFQFVVAVILSAQCTDKAVNAVTKSLFKRYAIPSDFMKLRQSTLQKEIKAIPFFRNKAKAIISCATDIATMHGGEIPNTERELVALHGVGYKTAHVILGELYGVYDGIPTDTHVKRFAHKFQLTQNVDLKKISKDLEAVVPKADWKYVNNGLVLYGRYVCKARPHDCTEHPLTKLWPKAARVWPQAK
jgi:endonuclease-3